MACEILVGMIRFLVTNTLEELRTLCSSMNSYEGYYITLAMPELLNIVAFITFISSLYIIGKFNGGKGLISRHSASIPADQVSECGIQNIPGPTNHSKSQYGIETLGRLVSLQTL